MRKLLLPFFILLSASLAQAQKVAGFFPDWTSASNVNTVQYDKLTDVYFAFLKPSTNGTLSTTTSGSANTILSPLAQKCHANGVKIHVSVGGANNSNNFASVVSSAANRQTFVNSAANFITTYDLDGINVDWEFPESQHAANLAKLMQELRTKLDQLEGSMGKELELSAAVAPLLYNTDGINADFIDACDYIHVMAFDAKDACCVCDENNHSSYAVAERSLKKWTTGLYGYSCGGSGAAKQVPAEKLILAIPFYSVEPYLSYKSISANSAATYFNDADGIIGSHNFNSKPLIDQKIKLIMETYKGGGVWAWELTQDRTDQYSLLGAMWDGMQPYMNGCQAPEPQIPTSASICGTGSVTLNTGVTESGYSFEWKKNGTTISGSTGKSLTVTEAGTYKVTVSGNDCSSKSATTVVDGTMLTVNDELICKGDNTTLTVAESGDFEWFTQASGGTAVKSGASYTISPTSTKTYYVGRVNSLQEYNLGKTSQTSGWQADASHYGQKLTAQVDLTLVSLDLTTAAAGSLDIVALDASDGTTERGRKSVSVSSGTQTVTINLSLDAGSYILVAENAPAGTLFIDSSVDTQDATISGIATIDKQTYTSWSAPKYSGTAANYGFFYNLVIATGSGVKGECERTPAKVTVDVCTSTNDELKEQLTLYPNPSNGSLTLEMTEGTAIGSYSIFNLTGQLMMQGKENNASTTINVEDLPKGVYSIQWMANGQLVNKKFVKQ